jgi:hypothetical protein
LRTSRERQRAGPWACCTLFLPILLLVGSAGAWHAKGHDQAVRFAVAASTQPASGGAATRPAEPLPGFFTDGVELIAHCSQDPDVFTQPIAPAQLNDAEAPEHYFDMELLGGDKPPDLRSDYLELISKKGLKTLNIGLLPYGVTEWTQRLTVTFAEYRKWPDNVCIRQKCLVYAGTLSHYAADLCQPLHTTIDYDGRTKDGKSPRSGIHRKVDALLGKVTYDRRRVLADLEIAPFDKLFPAVRDQIDRSHALVDRVYDLKDLLPDMDAPAGDEPKVLDFATDRMRACARFTACLYLTAWRDSQTIKLPEWHKRKQPGEESRPRSTGILPVSRRGLWPLSFRSYSRAGCP